MACDTPLLIAKAGTTSSKKNSRGHYTIYNEDLKVPCGKCPPCKRRRISDWVFRLLEEDKISSSSKFITLTYDTKCIPITQNGYKTLQRADFQKFMKRLRKKQLKHYPNSPPIKYYMAGEYGEKRYRPHYHAIIFNVIDTEFIATTWPLGTVDIGNVSGASIAYTCKYLEKLKRIPEHRNDDRKKEFSLMSNGLGKSFLTPQMIAYYQDDIKRYHVTTPDGIKIAMPTYYRKRIFSEDQQKLQTKYIQKLLKDKEELNIQEYAKLYPDHKTYHEYLDSARRSAYNNFYNGQIKRNLD